MVTAWMSTSIYINLNVYSGVHVYMHNYICSSEIIDSIIMHLSFISSTISLRQWMRKGKDLTKQVIKYLMHHLGKSDNQFPF